MNKLLNGLKKIERTKKRELYNLAAFDGFL